MAVDDLLTRSHALVMVAQSPRYVPAMGVTNFWHKGTYFRVYRKKESLVNTSGWGGTKDLEEIKISCSGRSMGEWLEARGQPILARRRRCRLP